MMDPKKKCISKKCKDCRLYISWDMENKNGLRKQMQKCILQVLAEEIPHIKGSIDGCQQAANESRNRAIEVKGIVAKATEDYVGSIKFIAQNQRLLK